MTYKPVAAQEVSNGESAESRSMKSPVQTPSAWSELLGPEKTKPYFLALLKFVAQRRQIREVYPPQTQVFDALKHCTLENLKVVIVGQDPYHGPGQAHGLSFSVKRGVPIPPSLQNIFKELQTDLGLTPPNHGFLESWAQQGVLLLNNVLTVERGQAHSHAKRGWEQFTDKVIESIDQQCQGIVFLLWGSAAQKKGKRIDRERHLVLTSPHPSPLSAHRGFFGCRHFSQCNTYLKQSGRRAIDWELPQ